MYQGISAYGSATWFERLTFSWLKPFIKQAQIGRISVEQCGLLSEDDKVEADLPRFNLHFKKYVASNDKNSLFFAMVITY